MDDGPSQTGTTALDTAAPAKNGRSFFQQLKNGFRRFFPRNGEDTLLEALEELMDDTGEEMDSYVARHERTLISNILELRDLPVVDVMLPRADIVAVDINASKDELFAILAQKPHSRLPVYRDTLDNVIGAIHLKDVLAQISANNPFEMKDILRNVMIVSPAMRVLDLLLQMRQSKVHMAMVVDEYGGIDGLITINDLIEAIVGEIDDEYGYEIQPQIIERPDGSVLVDARYPVEEFEEKYGRVMNEEEREDVDTLGGLVTTTTGRVPHRGEIVKHHSGMEFEIVEADPRRIMRLRIRKLPKRDVAEAATGTS